MKTTAFPNHLIQQNRTKTKTRFPAVLAREASDLKKGQRVMSPNGDRFIVGECLGSHKGVFKMALFMAPEFDVEMARSIRPVTMNGNVFELVE